MSSASAGPVYDAIVIGSGATGGWAAMDLAAGGMTVLVLEAGPRHADPPPPYAPWTRRAPSRRGQPSPWLERQPIQSKCYAYGERTRNFFVDDVENPYSTPVDMPFEWIRGRHVGGRSVTWLGHCYRMSDHDFKAASRDAAGDDWPIAYADLERHYARVERLLGVRGTCEGLPHLPDGEFAPPFALNPGEAHLKATIEKHLPDRRVIPARMAERFADGTSSAAGQWAPLSSPGSTLQAAATTGRMELRPDAVVRRLVVGDSGAVEGVEFIDRVTRQVVLVRSLFVILCASTIESTRVLLNSACATHPHGLGNSSGVLGRYLMDHLYGISVRGVLRCAPGYADEPAVRYAGLYVPQFRNVGGQVCSAFRRGYGIQVVSFPWLFRADLEAMRGSPEDRAKFAAQAPAHVTAVCFGEMLPSRENRVTLSDSSLDAFGIPVAHIACSHGDNDREMARDMVRSLEEMVRAAGIDALELSTGLAPPGRAIHEVGTARMGSDRRASVVDPYCRVWDAPNVYVTDGSCFVSGGCQNPTLTMLALTARACENLLSRWRRGGPVA